MQLIGLLKQEYDHVCLITLQKRKSVPTSLSVMRPSRPVSLRTLATARARHLVGHRAHRWAHCSHSFLNHRLCYPYGFARLTTPARLERRSRCPDDEQSLAVTYKRSSAPRERMQVTLRCVHAYCLPPNPRTIPWPDQLPVRRCIPPQ